MSRSSSSLKRINATALGGKRITVGMPQTGRLSGEAGRVRNIINSPNCNAAATCDKHIAEATSSDDKSFTILLMVVLYQLTQATKRTDSSGGHR